MPPPTTNPVTHQQYLAGDFPLMPDQSTIPPPATANTPPPTRQHCDEAPIASLAPKEIEVTPYHQPHRPAALPATLDLLTMKNFYIVLHFSTIVLSFDGSWSIDQLLKKSLDNLAGRNVEHFS
jgi:hypothetical protein